MTSTAEHDASSALESHEDEKAEIVEEKDLNRFERAEEFFTVLEELFPSPSAASSQASQPITSHEDRAKLMATLEIILHDYQEQSYLLDPHLERMIAPTIGVLQKSTRDSAKGGSNIESTVSQQNDQTASAAHLLYLYTKIRGYKTITRYFPHEVSDVIPTTKALLPCLLAEVGDQGSVVLKSWHLRYVLLLWLSLVVMIPFDLSKFDVGAQSTSTADDIVRICQHFLSSSGRERDAAAIVLGKLFQRRDASQTHLPTFIQWSQSHLSTASRPSALLATGILQTLCEILKTASPDIIAPHLQEIQRILSMGDHGTDDSDVLSHLRSNRLVNKYRSKLAGRMGLKILKPYPNGRGVTRKRLGGGVLAPKLPASQQEDEDVPEEIDAYIAQLLNGLQDSDTVVRYSAAKGLARICERLPAHFIDQVAEAITQLFSINALVLPGKEDDYSAVSEHTWQGACLALAELARRGLLNRDDMQDQLKWARRALFLDIRRGSHSVGSAVRDAACYFFWALARAYDADSLREDGIVLAQSLATLSLLDREVSIRRAASAAYQECVGRLGIFPHGIEIIGKTDFFSVGIRRNSFLVCMPAVALRDEYRPFLLRHLIKKTIVHWDPAMRKLGAQAIAQVIALSLNTLAPQLVDDLSPLCKSRDIFTLHGTLLALSEVAALCKARNESQANAVRTTIFRLLGQTPRQNLQSLGMGQVVEAACFLIANAACEGCLHEEQQATWEVWVDAAMKRKEETIHAAAAAALGTISSLRDCSAWIDRSIHGWRGLTEIQQQSLVLALGTMNITGSEKLKEVLRFLLSIVTTTSQTYSSRIETRRNSYTSVISGLRGLTARQPLPVTCPQLVHETCTALLLGLEDYTTDQRGDVGSWVRLACLQGARQLIDFLQGRNLLEQQLNDLLPDRIYHDVVAGVAKQMTERIDNVRAEAASHFVHLCTLPKHQNGFHEPDQLPLIRQVFDLDTATPTWEQLRDPAYLFPRVTDLLLIPRYRPAVLKGIVQSIGTKTELSQRVVSQTLLDFAMRDHEEFTARQLYEGLVQSATDNFTSNKIAVPYLQTIQCLLESDVLSLLTEDEDGGLPLMRRSFAVASRSLDKIKTPQRLTVTMHIIVDLLAVEDVTLRRDVIKTFPRFLAHSFPTVSVLMLTENS